MFSSCATCAKLVAIHVVKMAVITLVVMLQHYNRSAATRVYVYHMYVDVWRGRTCRCVLLVIYGSYGFDAEEFEHLPLVEGIRLGELLNL